VTFYPGPHFLCSMSRATISYRFPFFLKAFLTFRPLRASIRIPKPSFLPRLKRLIAQYFDYSTYFHTHPPTGQNVSAPSLPTRLPAQLRNHQISILRPRVVLLHVRLWSSLDGSRMRPLQDQNLSGLYLQSILVSRYVLENKLNLALMARSRVVVRAGEKRPRPLAYFKFPHQLILGRALHFKIGPHLHSQQMACCKLDTLPSGSQALLHLTEGFNGATAPLRLADPPSAALNEDFGQSGSPYRRIESLETGLCHIAGQAGLRTRHDALPASLPH
jgi:hypothetical protein